MRDRTAGLIAHWLTTIENADIIVVLDNGRVVGQGTRGDLPERGGLNHRLNTRDFAATRERDAVSG